MEIAFAATPSTEEENTILSVKIDEGETIRVGQMISIELVDGTFAKREIVSMSVWFKPEGKRGYYKEANHIEGLGSAEIKVEHLKSNTVQTTSMFSRETRRRWSEMICITPYMELKGGKKVYTSTCRRDIQYLIR